MDNQKFITCIDESGVANLNNLGDTFLLSTVTINKKDFEIIEGYLRLLKRQYLSDDFATLHATDLFERHQTHYPQLSTGNRANAFVQELGHVIGSVPFDCRIYMVNKDQLRARHGYTPAPRRTSNTLNLELPYEASAQRAILDFARYLVEHDAKGEIIIESRLFKDSEFVQTFDTVRQRLGPGGTLQPLHGEVNDRITSLLIANKHQQNGGLELADLCAYVAYRHKKGDPDNRLAINMGLLNQLHAAIKKHAYKGADDRDKRLVYELSP